MARTMDDLKIDIYRDIDTQMDNSELLPFRYQNQQGKRHQLCHTLPVDKGCLQERAIMIINSLTIIIVAGICFALYAAFRLGQEVGYDEGLVDGRKAVRKYYEQVGR